MSAFSPWPVKTDLRNSSWRTRNEKGTLRTLKCVSLSQQPCTSSIPSSAGVSLPASKCAPGKRPTSIHPAHQPQAHTHRIPGAPGHQQPLCIVLTKFKLLLKDLLALPLCYDILTHLGLRLPTRTSLAQPPWFPASIYKHSWEIILFPEVCIDYPTRSHYRPKELSRSPGLVSGPESESLFLCLLHLYLHTGAWGGSRNS